MERTSKYKVRKSSDRGSADHGWLKAKHSFSFADYQDPEHVNFRTMRVLNEDRIAPGRGFPKHAHENMEIITYVLSGSLKHEDSMGNTSIISPGDAQRMSAGTGVMHSEYNASEEETHLFQIWIFPEKNGLEPGYEQKSIPIASKKNKFCLIAALNPTENAVKIHQDAKIFASVLEKRKAINYSTEEDRHVWIQLASGSLVIEGYKMEAGDGLSVSPANALEIEAIEESEFLLFDLK